MQKNIFNLFWISILTLFIASCGSQMQSSSNLLADAPKPSNKSLQSPEFWQGNLKTIWGRLQFASIPDLQAVKLNDTNQIAWINLAIISKQDSLDTAKLTADLQAWHAANPHHAANALLPNDQTFKQINQTSQPKHIALLLPLSGPLGKQGQTVRDGFLNAYYASHSKQAISFYNTNSNNDVTHQYQKALKDGADFIIGPLTKDQVKNLLSRQESQTPTLALNYAEGSAPAHFYQFGLAPQDEAIQLADKAHQAGYSRALIIATQSDWGQRVVKVLSDRFKNNAGKVQEVLYVSPQTNLTQSIAKLLHVTPPTEGMNAAQVAPEKIANERRKDFDVVFLITSEPTARTVVPLLKYYYAGNTPVFATSSIFSGTGSLQNDRDLSGVTFCDTPWTILSGENGKTGGRLYAVGRDSYLLSQNINRLSLLPNFPLYGNTGALMLTHNRQIYRRLPWTTIRNDD